MNSSLLDKNRAQDKSQMPHSTMKEIDLDES